MVLTEITICFFSITLFIFIALLYLYIKSRFDLAFLSGNLFFLCSLVFLFGRFQLTHNLTPEHVIFWNKLQYLGIFGYLYTVPVFTATFIKIKLHRNINLSLGIITLIMLSLIVFTDLILRNQTEYRLGVLGAERGILFFPATVLLVLVSCYFYLQIIKISKRSIIKPVRYTTNYTPVIVGIGIGLCTGVLDMIGIILNRPLIPNLTRSFLLFGVFIISICYAWTFLSRYSTFFSALTESQTEHDRLIERYNRNFFEFVQLIAKTIDAKDHYTAGHSLRVRDYAVKIAKLLHLSDSEITLLEQAALLHDIGKIATPDGILNKKAPLTKEERQYINMHPVVAKEILSTVSDFEDILDIIYHHHERIDGKGYPDGISRDEIPLLARIIAVADTYDAMLSERPYRSAKTKQEAVEELIRVKGSQLDQKIVEKFVEILA